VIEADLVRWEGNIAKLSGKFQHALRVSVGGDRVSNNEAHHLISVEVRVDVGNLSIRLESDVLILEVGEVKDDFPALCH
jgi:hypothetical protein